MSHRDDVQISKRFLKAGTKKHGLVHQPVKP
jgi:hypothetical protein